MKYLSDYTEQEHTKVFNKYNAFFAFSIEQLREGKKEGLKYASRGAGLFQGYKDKKELKEFDEAFSKVSESGRKQDLKENGKEKIIERELNNYECYYTGEIEDTVEALASYNISEKEIIDHYNKNKNNVWNERD